MPVEIRKHPIGVGLSDFLGVADYLFRGDPHYARPLDLDTKDRLSTRNPFFDHAECALFTAHRNGWCVGRCSAQLDRLHLERHGDSTGFFGFFDTVDDPEVASELLTAAGNWLRERGMKRIRGPLSLNYNEEVGCLVQGFDAPAMWLTPHHRDYQAGLIERAGFTPFQELHAWRVATDDVPEAARSLHDGLARLPGVSVRHCNMKEFEVDLRTLLELRDDARRDSWAFAPYTDRELKRLSETLKWILIPELTYLVHVEGRPAAAALALPNLNELTRDLAGQLLPLGLPKLLWRLKVSGPKTFRIALLAVRKEFRALPQFEPLGAMLMIKLKEAGRRSGFQLGEWSWTSADDPAPEATLRAAGAATITKKYRLYERALTS
ncbi:MAG TPA: hypothetical protein VFQ61_39535 [Polyangiaceae bacterium]|nr:hypothetical protein [Polyangiaceae bacterium]